MPFISCNIVLWLHRKGHSIAVFFFVSIEISFSSNFQMTKLNTKYTHGFCTFTSGLYVNVKLHFSATFLMTNKEWNTEKMSLALSTFKSFFIVLGSYIFSIYLIVGEILSPTNLIQVTYGLDSVVSSANCFYPKKTWKTQTKLRT